MICKHYTDGPRLDVAGLNEITVLIDRTEAERSEVAVNTWLAGRDSPPHSHEGKEQNFLILAGRGQIKLGDTIYPASPGAFFYVPAELVHQTLSHPEEPLSYFLFNAFLNADKEGHASFASHIDLVKETRRQQALNQRAGSGPASEATHARYLPAYIPPPNREAAEKETFLLRRDQSERCEAIRIEKRRGERLVLSPDPLKEQTLFIESGDGVFSQSGESIEVEQGFVILIPRNTSAELLAGDKGLALI